MKKMRITIESRNRPPAGLETGFCVIFKKKSPYSLVIKELTTLIAPLDLVSTGSGDVLQTN